METTSDLKSWNFSDFSGSWCCFSTPSSTWPSLLWLWRSECGFLLCGGWLNLVWNSGKESKNGRRQRLWINLFLAEDSRPTLIQAIPEEVLRRIRLRSWDGLVSTEATNPGIVWIVWTGFCHHWWTWISQPVLHGPRVCCRTFQLWLSLNIHWSPPPHSLT